MPKAKIVKKRKEILENKRQYDDFKESANNDPKRTVKRIMEWLFFIHPTKQASMAQGLFNVGPT